MKKFIALLIAMTMCTALFCIVSSAEADPDTWLCVEAESYQTGWWMGPAAGVNNGDIEVVFTTPNAFDGFIMACYASPDHAPAVLEVVLLDKNGIELESQEITIANDHQLNTNKISVEFDKAYAAGTYSIDFIFIDGEHFVLGEGAYNELQDDIYVTGTNNPQVAMPEYNLHAAQAPAIMLIGAEPPTDEISSETTADSSEPEEESSEPAEESSEPAEESSEPAEESSEPAEETSETAEESTETEEESKDDATDTEAPTGDPKDVNGDGEANNKDVVELFRYVSKGDAEYNAEYDIDGSKEVNNKDVVALFRALSEA